MPKGSQSKHPGVGRHDPPCHQPSRERGKNYRPVEIETRQPSRAEQLDEPTQPFGAKRCAPRAVGAGLLRLRRPLVGQTTRNVIANLQGHKDRREDQQQSDIPPAVANLPRQEPAHGQQDCNQQIEDPARGRMNRATTNRSPNTPRRCASTLPRSRARRTINARSRLRVDPQAARVAPQRRATPPPTAQLPHTRSRNRHRDRRPKPVAPAGQSAPRAWRFVGVLPRQIASRKKAAMQSPRSNLDSPRRLCRRTSGSSDCRSSSAAACPAAGGGGEFSVVIGCPSDRGNSGIDRASCPTVARPRTRTQRTRAATDREQTADETQMPHAMMVG